MVAASCILIKYSHDLRVYKCITIRIHEKSKCMEYIANS